MSDSFSRPPFDSRRAALRHLREIYRDPDDDKVHEVPIWEAWLERSGELPPDFNTLPVCAGLPPLLNSQDGSAITNSAGWTKRRAEIFDLLRHYQIGNPPVTFAWKAHIIERIEDETCSCIRLKVDLLIGATQEAVEKLTYTGPASYQAAYLKLEVGIPFGDGPFPALVGPDFRKYAGQRGSWRVPKLPVTPTLYELALRRGYITCTFDQNDAFACRMVFPKSDCTELAWWGWAAARCIDYIMTLPELDSACIAAAGHSRGGAAALMAAVLDERITAVVASHCGAGGTVPLRACGEKFGSQTLEVHTRLFPYISHPRLRFFCGRENRLPFDTHFFMALVAPRAMLITAGIHDPVGQLHGSQQAYEAVREVYALLGQPSRLNFGLDEGGHTLAEDTPSKWLDWIDLQFSRRPGAFANKIPYDYSFEAWRQVVGRQVNPMDWPEENSPTIPIAKADWPFQRAKIASRMNWLLGECPERPLPDHLVPELIEVYDRHYSFRNEGGLATFRLAVYEDLELYLTVPLAAWQSGGRLPVVIYCHAYCDQRGLAWERHESYAFSPVEYLAQQGFVAVQFDLFGYGRRNQSASLDYFRTHPQRSGLGVMTADVVTVLDVLERLPNIDISRVGILGYSLGGLVALFSGAKDERLKAIAMVCALGSFRFDAHGSTTEGLGRYCLTRPTLPLLGFFIGHEKRVPVDLDEVMALIAPRPAHIVAPQFDQDWMPEDVDSVVMGARPVYDFYGAGQQLVVDRPEDFNRFVPKKQKQLANWLAQQLGL